MKQEIGAYMLMMLIGSTLGINFILLKKDWVIVSEYISDYLQFKNKSQNYLIEYISHLTPFLMIMLNLGMFFRICLYKRFIRLRNYMPFICIVVYSISWLLITFLVEHCQYIILTIFIVSFLNGIIFVDPIERIIYIYKQKREIICSIMLTGFGLGWFLFTLILELAFNPYNNNDSTLYFQQGCLINVACILFVGLLGSYLFYAEPDTKTQSFALELANKKINLSDFQYRSSEDQNFLSSIYEKPLRVLKSWHFYRIIICLFFCFNCGIGSIIFLHRVGQNEYIYYILEAGFGLIIGLSLPIAIPSPFPEKPVVGMIQLLGMLLILFLGFFNVNGSLQEFFFFFQMTWFGLTISLAFIICGNNFGWFSIVEIFPLVFASLTLSGFIQLMLSSMVKKNLKQQGILLIEQVGLIIGFLINIFNRQVLSSQQ